jgi:phenylalanyl-tRNA synthetase alpha chain
MNVIDELQMYLEEANNLINLVTSEDELDSTKNLFIGKKGKITGISKKLGTLEIEERKIVGQKINSLTVSLESIVLNKRSELKNKELNELIEKEKYDSKQPVKQMEEGTLHPITSVQMEVEDIFISMGFEIWDGPEIETDYNNFEALNFTDDHPARDMQDTFYTDDGNLLRTHTSAIQVRALKVLKPPFRIIAPGRVFRYEEIDASHENTFNQVEGMVVGKNITVGNLTYTMNQLLSKIFRKETVVRLRPGYFPFVEPGFELDFQCMVCNGKGCSVCKHSGWVELLPCGLIHPNVLKFAGLDSEEWTGFAFGLGLDRLVMMRYGITDIRYFNSGNLRFLKKFL